MTPQGIQTRFARKIMAELAGHSETAHRAHHRFFLPRETDHA